MNLLSKQVEHVVVELHLFSHISLWFLVSMSMTLMVRITFYQTVWGTHPQPGEAADRKFQVFAHEFWLSEEDLERSSCCAHTYRNLTACATRRTDSVNVVERKENNIHILQPDQYIRFCVLPSCHVFLLLISVGEFLFWLYLYKLSQLWMQAPHGSVAGQLLF